MQLKEERNASTEGIAAAASQNCRETENGHLSLPFGGLMMERYAACNGKDPVAADGL
jgi:hypothetical protein